jgi:hypothetical protein
MAAVNSARAKAVKSAKTSSNVAAQKPQRAASKAARSKSTGANAAADKVAASKKSAGSKSAGSKSAGNKAAGNNAGGSKAASRAAGVNGASKKAASNAGMYGPRPDLGAPIDGFFAKQPAPLRPILEELRTLIEEAAPDASSSLKWGMPFFTVGGTMMCALGGHKSHVNLILSGPTGTYADPDGRLSGEGKTGRHLKLTRLDELPRDAVRRWLRTAAELARRS